jgi:prolyl oligopeptidase PreP (S9A serine peptidase family)
MVRNMPDLVIPSVNNRSKSAAAAEGDADAYRWLEDSASPETAAWMTAQNELTQAYLASVPAREVIRSRLTERWDFPRSGVPFERGGRWFAVRNPGLRHEPVLWVMDAPDAEGRVLLDPNALAADGTVAISVSPDGSKVAYATSAAGSDWLTWHVRDVAAGADLGDALEWCKSERAEWDSGSSGFYYAAMPPPRGKATAKAIAETADRLVFIEGALGMSRFPPWVPCSDHAGGESFHPGRRKYRP